MFWNKDEGEWRISVVEAGESFLQHVKKTCESHGYEARFDLADDETACSIAAIITHVNEIKRHARKLSAVQTKK